MLGKKKISLEFLLSKAPLETPLSAPQSSLHPAGAGVWSAGQGQHRSCPTSVHKHSSKVLSCWRPPLFFAQRWSIKKHSPDSCSLLQSSVQVRVTQDGPGAPESVVTGTGSWDPLGPQRCHHHSSCRSETAAASAWSIRCVSNEIRMFAWAQSSSSSDQKRKTEGERDREREKERQRQTEREIQWETHRKRERQRQAERESVCVCVWHKVACQAPLSVWPHGLWPIRLLCPWDFPGKKTSGWPFPPLGDLLDPGIEPTSPEFPSTGRGILYRCTTRGSPWLRTTAGSYPDDSSGEWNSRQKTFSAFSVVRRDSESTLRLGMNRTLRGASRTSFVGLPWWSSGWESILQCRGRRFNPWSRS